jgi:hypothetical protein
MKAVLEDVSHQEAKEKCHAMGGSLASIQAEKKICFFKIILINE